LQAIKDEGHDPETYVFDVDKKSPKKVAKRSSVSEKSDMGDKEALESEDGIELDADDLDKSLTIEPDEVDKTEQTNKVVRYLALSLFNTSRDITLLFV
jgi:hypothetical protein